MIPRPTLTSPGNHIRGFGLKRRRQFTQFLYERHPDLVKSLCQRLSAAGRESDKYIAEARDILIPPLERVLERGRERKEM